VSKDSVVTTLTSYSNLAGNVADMSVTCRPDTAMSANFSRKGMLRRHTTQKEAPTHSFCVLFCRHHTETSPPHHAAAAALLRRPLPLPLPRRLPMTTMTWCRFILCPSFLCLFIKRLLLPEQKQQLPKQQLPQPVRPQQQVLPQRVRPQQVLPQRVRLQQVLPLSNPILGPPGHPTPEPLFFLGCLYFS